MEINCENEFTEYVQWILIGSIRLVIVALNLFFVVLLFSREEMVRSYVRKAARIGTWGPLTGRYATGTVVDASNGA
jgi:hypothetical protein